MPRAPLLGGLSPQVTGGLSPKQLLPLNLSVIFADARCHLSGLRLPAVASCKCTRTLLAAAPTTPPCFRHWRRSSSLPSRGGLGMRFIFRSDRWRSKSIICRKAEITLRQQSKQ